MSHNSCNMRTRDLLDISALAGRRAYISGKSLVSMLQLLLILLLFTDVPYNKLLKLVAVQ